MITSSVMAGSTGSHQCAEHGGYEKRQKARRKILLPIWSLENHLKVLKILMKC